MKKRQRKKNAKRDALIAGARKFVSVWTSYRFKVDTSKLREVAEDVQGTNLHLKLQAARKALLDWQKANPEAARRHAGLIWQTRLLRRYLSRDEKGESTAHGK